MEIVAEAAPTVLAAFAIAVAGVLVWFVRTLVLLAIRESGNGGGSTKDLLRRLLAATEAHHAWASGEVTTMRAQLTAVQDRLDRE